MTTSDGRALTASRRPSWARAAKALTDGYDLASACVVGELGPVATSRLLPRWAGAWVDVLDGVDGARVMVVDRSPSRAAVSLADRAAVIAFAEDDRERAVFRRTWLHGRRGELLLGDEDGLVAEGHWDLMVLDGTLFRAGRHRGANRARMRRLGAALAPGGRLVVIADNRLSPLRALDRARGRARGGQAVRSLPAVAGALDDAGLAVRQRFCLLRSSTVPVTCFDLEAPAAAGAVLTAASVPIGDRRGVAIRALRRLGRNRAVARLVPGWLVVASRSGDAWEASPTRPTGRFGYAHSDEMKILRGEPPRALEKSYQSPALADREAMALEVIAGSGLQLAPRLLGRPAPDRTCQTWLRGRPLSPSQLSPQDLRVCVLSAVGALAALHRATARPDGRVLVHGDFWLGNVLVDGDGLSVVGVIDWSQARWADGEEDLTKLLDDLFQTRLVTPSEGVRLTLAARRTYAAALQQPCRCPPRTGDPGVTTGRPAGHADGSPAPAAQMEEVAPVPVRTMAPTRALVTNTAALVTGRYAVAALGWLGTLLIIRSLSVEEWGRFSFVFSLLGVLAIFTELGVGRVAIKGLLEEEDDDGHFAGTLVMLRTAMGAAGYLLAMGFVLAAGYPSEVIRATAIGGLILLLATASSAVQGVFQAHLQMRAVAVGNVLGQLTQIALITAIATLGGSVVLFTAPAVAGEVTILAWRMRRVRRLQKIRLNVDLALWRRLLREAAPLAVGMVMATFSFKIDLLMLSKLDTFTAVGIYGVAYKFVDLVHDLPSALMVPVLALMVRAWPNDEHVLAQTFQRALVLLFAGGVFVAVEFALFAGPVVTLLYGEQYAAGAHAARLIVAAECLAALGSLAFTVLLATGRHRAYPLVTLLGLITNVGLNLWLIPRRSYEGAALATVATEILVVGLLWVAVMRVPAVRPVRWRPLALTLLAGTACAVVAGSSQLWAPWPVAAAAGAGAYLVVLHVGNRRGGGLIGLVALRADR